MTPEHVKSRIDEAIDTVDAALDGTGLMSEAFWLDPRYTPFVKHEGFIPQYGVLMIFVADCWSFAVHTEEIKRNTGRGLVKLVMVRLEAVLSQMQKQVADCWMWVPKESGSTLPVELIQGL